MNKTGGRATFSGINAQSWAAMSLFLQFVQRSDFQSIGFEAKDLEDFYLVFSGGKKMICESKNFDINYADVKSILEKIHKHNQINAEDDIVIICKSVNKNVSSDFENYKYFNKEITERLISSPHNYQDHHLKLLPQVKFWEVPQDINERIVKILLVSLLRIWVSETRLEEIKDNIVLQEVFHGSAKGKVLSKDEFKKKLEQKKVEILTDAGYDLERKTGENDVKELLDIVEKNGKVKIPPNKVSDISRNPSEFYFLITKLGEKNDLSLLFWDDLWQAAVNSFLSIHLFGIFRNNLTTEENQRYSIDFASKVLEGGFNFFREEFIKTDIVDLCKDILQNPKFDREVFEVIKKLFKPDVTDFFFRAKTYGSDRHEWEKEKISELTKELYNRTNEVSLKEEIIMYLGKTFNLAMDNGQFWHYTPPDIFNIFKEDLESSKNLEEKILGFKDLCIQHYDNFEKRFDPKWKFSGWELTGSGISQSGSIFSISDTHFVNLVLKPALETLYKNSPTGWDFIVMHCISRKVDDVSREKPDFLNRASLPILLTEYKNGTRQNDSFEILSDFVRMRKGIPWKNDLIFQELRGDYSDEKKWKLVEVSLKEFKNLPVNVFVEQIVSDLAEREHSEAIRTIQAWVNDPKYEQMQTFGSNNVMENISKLLKNPKTFNDGVIIFEKYIQNDAFIKKNNDWKSWEVAKVLANIISINLAVGINILKKISQNEKLSQNQQTLICGAINDIQNPTSEVLKKVYSEFVSVFLLSLNNDIDKVVRKITNRYSRQQIVQFAEKLAQARYFPEALSIVKIFIKDPDPRIGNYKDDSEGKFNYHRKIIEGDDNPTITTVRGYCAWVLQKFAVLTGRNYIPDIIPLVKRLSKDRNYYVRVQACIPLIDLARNRDTVLPTDKTERFIPRDCSKEIKKIAFEMLNSKTNQKLPAVMKNLAMVFSYIRNVNERDAWKILNTFLKDSYPKKIKTKGRELYLTDILNEAASLYIFFAEYRKTAFKNWPKSWGDLSGFDDRRFKKLLRSLLKNKNPEIRRIFSWHIARLPEEVKDRPEFKSTVKLSINYLKLATYEYDHHTFESIYHFIEDYIFNDDFFDLCFSLWTNCIETESKYFKENYSPDKIHEMYWWPFFYNGKILARIAGKNADEFIKWLKILIDYPTNVLIANDLETAVDKLMSIKDRSSQIEEVLNKLIERDPKYYELKQKWMSEN